METESGVLARCRENVVEVGPGVLWGLLMRVVGICEKEAGKREEEIGSEDGIGEVAVGEVAGEGTIESLGLSIGEMPVCGSMSELFVGDAVSRRDWSGVLEGKRSGLERGD